MLNIEIHGFDSVEAEGIRRKIAELFCVTKYGKDITVEIFLNTFPRSIDGKLRPYLQLVSDLELCCPRLIKKLSSLGFPISHVQRAGFFDAK